MTDIDHPIQTMAAFNRRVKGERGCPDARLVGQVHLRLHVDSRH